MRAFFPSAPRDGWTVEESARFAATRDVLFLELLGNNKKALTTFRRLGSGQTAAVAHSLSTGAASKGEPDVGKDPPAAAAARIQPTRRRRNAERSARHHAKRRQLLLSRLALCVTFVVRLRRAVARRTRAKWACLHVVMFLKRLCCMARARRSALGWDGLKEGGSSPMRSEADSVCSSMSFMSKKRRYSLSSSCHSCRSGQDDSSQSDAEDIVDGLTQGVSPKGVSFGADCMSVG